MNDEMKICDWVKELTPCGSFCGINEGDELVLLKNIPGELEAGTVLTALHSGAGCKRLEVSCYKGNMVVNAYEVARVPWVSPETANDEIKIGDWVWGERKADGKPIAMKVNKTSGVTPSVCPAPELEGIWERHGVVYRVEWNSQYVAFIVISQNGIESDLYPKNWKPDETWTQIEQAPRESINGGKLARPPKHGGIEVPWDPYTEG